MDELMDMIVADESPSQISDRIKDMLFAKSAERVDAHKTTAASALFGQQPDEEEIESEPEVEAELETADAEEGDE